MHLEPCTAHAELRSRSFLRVPFQSRLTLETPTHTKGLLYHVAHEFLIRAATFCAFRKGYDGASNLCYCRIWLWAHGSSSTALPVSFRKLCPWAFWPLILISLARQQIQTFLKTRRPSGISTSENRTKSWVGTASTNYETSNGCACAHHQAE